MSLAEAFWGGLTASALLWYVSVTVYVAVRGASDLRVMFRRLTRPPQVEEANDHTPQDWQSPADGP
jgi:hypothetical protein